jgi:hypothetical protein
MSDWGKGVNNNIGWGQGADNNIGWGSIYDKSNAGETLLSGGGSSIEGFLDNFSIPDFTLDLNRVNKTYTGFSITIRVKKAGVNYEKNIGFFDDELDIDAIETFCEGNDAFVSYVYGQSSVVNDSYQQAESSQPRIAINGVVILENGKPAMEFDGVDDFFLTDNYAVELSANDAQVFAINTPFGIEGNYLLNEADDADFSSNFILGDSIGAQALWVNVTKFGSSQVNAQQVFGFEKTGGSGTGSKTFQTFKNGATDGASGNATVNTEVLDTSGIGSRSQGQSNFYKGKVQSIIVYKHLNNDYVSIMNTIKAFYQI